MITVPGTQVSLYPRKFLAVLGAAHVAAPLALQGEWRCWHLVLRGQPLQPAMEACFIAPMHQLPGAACYVAQQGPVIDADCHVRDGHILCGQCRQSLEATAKIIAKQPEGAANKGQFVTVRCFLAQQIPLPLCQQGQGIRVKRQTLFAPGYPGQWPLCLQGCQRVGADDVKAVVRSLRAGRFEQHGPGLMMQTGKQRMQRCLVIKVVDMKSWFHFLLHRQQFAPCSLAGMGGQAYHRHRNF